MPHPADKQLDELTQLLTQSHAECIDKSMPYTAQMYEGYLSALKSLRLSHDALQEQILSDAEEEDLEDDSSIEEQLHSFVESLGYRKE